MAQTMARVPLFVRARFFDRLADPARLALLEALRHGERTAGELVGALGEHDNGGQWTPAGCPQHERANPRIVDRTTRQHRACTP
jgi:DNA-binding transcriptional ArsR family regulator